MGLQRARQKHSTHAVGISAGRARHPLRSHLRAPGPVFAGRNAGRLPCSRRGAHWPASSSQNRQGPAPVHDGALDGHHRLHGRAVAGADEDGGHEEGAHDVEHIALRPPARAHACTVPPVSDDAMRSLSRATRADACAAAQPGRALRDMLTVRMCPTARHGGAWGALQHNAVYARQRGEMRVVGAMD